MQAKLQLLVSNLGRRLFVRSTIRKEANFTPHPRYCDPMSIITVFKEQILQRQGQGFSWSTQFMWLVWVEG